MFTVTLRRAHGLDWRDGATKRRSDEDKADRPRQAEGQP
jgi:hypothetical protein